MRTNGVVARDAVRGLGYPHNACGVTDLGAHRAASRRRRPPVAALGSALAALLATAPIGCTRTLAPDIHADDPAVKIPAIVQADGSREQLAALVDALEHDDPAVRLFAIESLRRITGEDLGYQPYDTPARRDRAVQAWRRQLDENSLSAGNGSP